MLPPERTHPFRLSQNVFLHGVCQFLASGPGFQIQSGVKRIKSKKIAMRLAGRWAWAAIANATEIICALKDPILKCLLRWHSFWQSRLMRENVPDHPVRPRSSWGIRIIRDERQ